MPKSKNVTYPHNAQTKLSGNRLNIQVQVGLTIQLEKRIVCSLVLRSNISTKNQHQYRGFLLVLGTISQELRTDAPLVPTKG